MIPSVTGLSAGNGPSPEGGVVLEHTQHALCESGHGGHLCTKIRMSPRRRRDMRGGNVSDR